MLDPVLKKFGLFQARKHLKKNYSACSQQNQCLGGSLQKMTDRSVRQCSSKRQKTNYQKPMLVQIIELLQTKATEKCHHRSHDNNKIKYICLSEECQQNFGCAHCFLYHHKGHIKAEIGICLRDLYDLNSYTKKSYETILTKKNLLRIQTINQIDIQIKNLCNQFHSNLQFLKNKVIKDIDDYLYQKYEVYDMLTLKQSKQQMEFAMDTHVREAQLISNLLKIDIKGIQMNLEKQIARLNSDKLNTKMYTKYFSEMNSSMSHFMAQFKQCFPSLYLYKDQNYCFQTIKKDKGDSSYWEEQYTDRSRNSRQDSNQKYLKPTTHK